MRLNTPLLNFYVCSCRKSQERLAFTEVAALVDQYPIGQTGVDRGTAARQGVPDDYGADMWAKRAAEMRVDSLTVRKMGMESMEMMSIEIGSLRPALLIRETRKRVVSM